MVIEVEKNHIRNLPNQKKRVQEIYMKKQNGIIVKVLTFMLLLESKLEIYLVNMVDQLKVWKYFII